MLHIEGWKRVVIWATCALGLLFALPNGFYGQVESYNDAQEAGQEATGWPSFLPSGLVNLGLDLRGGAHLLGEVKLEEVYTTRLEGFWPEVRNALRTSVRRSVRSASRKAVPANLSCVLATLSKWIAL